MGDGPSAGGSSGIGGARALNLDHLVGSLVPGKRAGLIVIDLSPAHATPSYNPISQIAYVTKGPDVKTVIVDGRVIYQDRQYLTLDLATARRRVQGFAAELAARHGLA